VSGALELQVGALLGRVHRIRDERIGELRAAAAVQRQALAVDARREARRLLHAASRDKRERVRERCQQALAELDARRRRRDFGLERELIDAALAAMPAALERRWHDAPGRRAWCANAVAVAAARLVARDWQVALAAGTSAEECAALAATAATHGARIEFGPSAQRAGLTVGAGSSVVDATIAGLLGDRAGIASRLLALWLGGGVR
jgi:hypothetical protein